MNDGDLGVYYLQSRYYAFDWGRFINFDIPDIAQQSKHEINGLNLFAYCCNDPVNNSDPSGYEPWAINYSYKNSRIPNNFGNQNLSKDGYTMLMACEDFRSRAYKALPSEEYYTYGYGHYGSDVKKNSTITKKNAEKLLKKDIKIYEKNLNAFLIKYRIYLYQYQFDSCIIDSYQKGQNMWLEGKWRKYDLCVFLEKYRVFNCDNHRFSYKDVKKAFMGTVNSNDGLKQRRTAEARLFYNGWYAKTNKAVYG